MAVEETIQTVRESPEIEAYRIGLLKSAGIMSIGLSQGKFSV